MMQTTMTPVGLGELKTSSNRDEILVCYGLGSCIGLALYDSVVHAGALVHVVLPDSSLSRDRDVALGRFADTAVPHAVAQLAKLGAAPVRLSARMVGGAHMLNVSGGSKLDIGNRNIEAVKAALQSHGVRLTAEDTGGTYGRTVQLLIGTGKLLVSTVGRGERVL